MLTRFVYFGYYLKELDWPRFRKFRKHVHQLQQRSVYSLWKDILQASFRYNISILEYFNFGFYHKESDRNSYAGTGYMYEYQLQMNPKESRAVLADKLKFLKTYAPFVRHEFASLVDLEKDPALASHLLGNPSGKVVLKASDGQCGEGIEVVETNTLTPESFIERLKASGNDMVEAYVVQHKDLMKLSDSGLNTIRIVTQLNKDGGVDLLGARLRITINSSVDNLAAGNIAAPIDLETGKVIGPGVYSDITRSEEAIHPVSGVSIVGFQIPFWKETLQLALDAALVDPRNRSIGWDVAVTDEGPELIEGNHDWCKLLWQLPVKKGLKPVLEAYKKGIK